MCQGHHEDWTSPLSCLLQNIEGQNINRRGVFFLVEKKKIKIDGVKIGAEILYKQSHICCANCCIVMFSRWVKYISYILISGRSFKEEWLVHSTKCISKVRYTRSPRLFTGNNLFGDSVLMYTHESCATHTSVLICLHFNFMYTGWSRLDTLALDNVI